MHLGPPPILLIKIKNDTKLDKDCIKNKVHRDTMSEKSDIYEFKMALFENGETEELLLSIHKFQTTLEASGTLSDGTKIQYLRMLVHGEALNQLDMLSVGVGIATTEHLILILLGLGTYFFTVIAMSKQKCVMRCGMRNSH